MFIRHSSGKVKETDIWVQSSGERIGVKEKQWKMSVVYKNFFKGVKLMQSNKYSYRHLKVLALGHFKGLGKELVEQARERKPGVVRGKFLGFQKI